MLSKDIEGYCNFQVFYDEIANLLKNDSVVVEVGVFLGKSVVFMCEKLKEYNKTTKVIAVDTWRGSVEHQELVNNIGGEDVFFEKFIDNIKQSGFSDNVVVKRESSVESSKSFPNESIDFIFIDASHQYQDVLDDINAWLPKVKKGGIISGHDYHSGLFPGVIKAVNQVFGKPDRVIENCSVWVKYV